MMGHIASSNTAAGVSSNKNQSHTDDDAGPKQNQTGDHEDKRSLENTNSIFSSTGATFFEQLRSLFVYPESYSRCLTVEYRNWHTTYIDFRMSETPPDCVVDEENPVKAEPGQDGRLRIHTLVPAEYPGGKQGFYAGSDNFLRDQKNYGIQQIHMGEAAINSFLKQVNENFKIQSKSSKRNKNKDSKGKAIKWKNPAISFGCRYVWAHDLAMPHLLYFRVRPSCMDLPALVVIDTSKEEYKQQLNGDKEKFLQVALPQIHLHLVLTHYQTLFSEGKSQLKISNTQADPSQPWWWEIIKHHNEQYAKELEESVMAGPSNGAKAKTLNGQTTTSDIGGLPEEQSDKEETLETLDDGIFEQGPSQVPPCQEEEVSDSGDVVKSTPSASVSNKRKQKRKTKHKKGDEASSAHTEVVDVKSTSEELKALDKGKEPETCPKLQEPSDSTLLETAKVPTIMESSSDNHSKDNTVEKSVESQKPCNLNELAIVDDSSIEDDATHAVLEAIPAASDAVPNGNAGGETHSKKKSKANKKKSKKKSKGAKKSNKSDSEKAPAGPVGATSNHSGLTEALEDGTGWNVVSHGKKRRGSFKSKPSHENLRQEDGQLALPRGREGEPSNSTVARVPPPKITESEFPPLPSSSEKTVSTRDNVVDRGRTLARVTQAAQTDDTANEQQVKGKREITATNSTVKSNAGAPKPIGPVGLTPFIQLDSTGFKCSLANCEKRCCSLDYTSVICPRCGPLSEIRYCGQEHLFADVKNHWVWCGQYTFTLPTRGELPVIDSPPLLPNYCQWDNPERHRQAVHHAVDRSGDYFIFSDWEDYINAGQPADILNIRCPTRVVHVVSFDEPAMKDRFRRVLGICLFTLPTHVIFLGYLFRMIRDNLRAQGVWSGTLDQALRYQMKLEFCCELHDWYTGFRHACETDWTLGQRRSCRDPICMQEYQHLLGNPPSFLEERAKNLEANFWLLRAHRYTHPDIPGMSEEAIQRRTRGEGFEYVLEEDQRLFGRGKGWDWPEAEMEIEEACF